MNWQPLTNVWDQSDLELTYTLFVCLSYARNRSLDRDLFCGVSSARLPSVILSLRNSLLQRTMTEISISWGQSRIQRHNSLQHPLISKSASPFTNPLWIVPRAPINTGITITFRFHSFFSSQARFWYSSIFSFSFNFTPSFAGQILFFLFFISVAYYYYYSPPFLLSLFLYISFILILFQNIFILLYFFTFLPKDSFRLITIERGLLMLWTKPYSRHAGNILVLIGI